MLQILVIALVGLTVLGFFLLMPRWGLRARLQERRAFRHRVALEDALKHLHAAEERGVHPTIQSVAGALRVSTRRAAEIARTLHERGLATTEAGLVLSPAGARAARQVVRAHRLWERYLADELHTPAVDLHRLADRQEHLLHLDEVEHLAAHLGHPEHDPHGDPIPVADARAAPPRGWPVTLVTPGAPSEIVHLEDEPEAVFARLVELGLEVGSHVTVEEIAPDRIVLTINGERRELSPVDAANVFVVPVRKAPPGEKRTLADLHPGEAGRVRQVEITGFARRRLFDLGFTPGASVECAFPGAFGEPQAYRVRGSLIALRGDQARRIEIEPADPASEPR